MFTLQQSPGFPRIRGIVGITEEILALSAPFDPFGPFGPLAEMIVPSGMRRTNLPPCNILPSCCYDHLIDVPAQLQNATIRLSIFALHKESLNRIGESTGILFLQ